MKFEHQPASAVADVQVERPGAPPFIGESPRVRSIKTLAASIAARRSTVMILGETGTGKEMLARYIHRCSERAGGPFIPVDCSSLSDNLFESQLFGHVRGAFTGAVSDSLGFIRAASGGTLFLDEIGELSLCLQAKLLRVIQEKCVVPVGDTRGKPVDIRIITATNRDLQAMVGRGAFRQDLYYRLNVVTLCMPPLRERPQDVLPLARHFLEAHASLYGERPRRLSPEAAEALQRYPWPGNVRELANAMEHAHVVAAGDVVRLDDLYPQLQRPRHQAPVPGETLCLRTLERQAITEALRRTNGNKAGASRLLNINIQRLSRRIETLGIPVGAAKATASRQPADPVKTT
jgi:transcriptional regulator with PAS, ATPase and Fis domain